MTNLRFKHNSILALTSGVLLATALGCSGAEELNQEEIALRIGRGIAAACPMSEAGDEQSRANCAAKLTDFKLLRDTMQEPFLWGGQKAGKGYRLSDSDTTRFNALVWRRMYLSLFMFTGEVRTETVGDFTVIHLPYRFRNQLDPGSYPYPFWHTAKKWENWQLSPELVLVMEKGKITGALRSADRTDEAERRTTYVERSWSGEWNWTKDGKEMPYVSLYTYLFSPTNPHVAKLDTAFRALESEMRSNACLVCHSPDNFAKTGQLEFFNYPNQALYARHSIVMHLEKNTMPPKNDFGLPKGMADETERLELLNLAKAFEQIGDDALAYEGELKPWTPPMPPVEMPQ
jgi:hypothetical protein